MGTPAIADNGIKIYINDELRSVDPEPFIENGRTYVPIRFIAENFGAAVDWDASQERVTIRQPGKKIDIFINDNQALINGCPKVIDVAPMIVKGRTVVPLRFIAEDIGLDVRWDGNTKSIFISSLNNKTQESITFVEGVIFDPLADIKEYTIEYKGDNITDIIFPATSPHNITIGSILVIPPDPYIRASINTDIGGIALKAISIINEGETIRINFTTPELAEVIICNNSKGNSTFDPSDVVVADGVEFEYIPNESIDDISFMLEDGRKVKISLLDGWRYEEGYLMPPATEILFLLEHESGATFNMGIEKLYEPISKELYVALSKDSIAKLFKVTDIEEEDWGLPIYNLRYAVTQSDINALVLQTLMFPNMDSNNMIEKQVEMATVVLPMDLTEQQTEKIIEEIHVMVEVGERRKTL